MSFLLEEYICDVIEEGKRLSEHPKCCCPFSVALWDEKRWWLDWYRCSSCDGLVALTRVFEGTATVREGMLH